MTSTAIFAYGSLVDEASASTTLGHPIEPMSMATLAGWHRRYSKRRDNRHGRKSFRLQPGLARELGLARVPAHTMALNIEPSPGARPGVNGALLAVDAADLAHLDRREGDYERIEVTGAITPAPPAGLIAFAYVAMPEARSWPPPEDSIVIAAYAEAVERAFSRLGADQARAFAASTDPPVRLAEADLISAPADRRLPQRW